MFVIVSVCVYGIFSYIRGRKFLYVKDHVESMCEIRRLCVLWRAGVCAEVCICSHVCYLNVCVAGDRRGGGGGGYPS